MSANGIQIAYESYGSPSAAPVLLIMGLGLPLSAWPPTLVDAVTAAGFQVVAFDNRDVGQSTQLVESGVPNVPLQMLRHLLRLRVQAPYTLADMVEDTRCLLDELGLDRVHVVGASMGGMIAQLLAMTYPERCLSLTSIMSTTGDRRLPGPRWPVLRLAASAPRNDDMTAQRAFHERLWPVIGSPGNARTDDELKRFLDRVFARGIKRSGVARQLCAIGASPNRSVGLAKLQAIPTLVIHGTADPLIPVAAGHATAAAIPGSRLQLIEGMGHDLPETFLPLVTESMLEHFANAYSSS